MCPKSQLSDRTNVWAFLSYRSLQIVGRAKQRNRNAPLELLWEWEIRTLHRSQMKNARGELPIQQGAAWKEDMALAKTCPKHDVGMVGHT